MTIIIIIKTNTLNCLLDSMHLAAFIMAIEFNIFPKRNLFQVIIIIIIILFG